MPQIATITSKRQLTIPIRIFKEARLRKGQKVVLAHERDGLRLEPATQMVEKLDGSVKVTAKFRGQTLDELITQAKKEHFSK